MLKLLDSNKRVHNHPKMERDKEIDSDHVIIDKDVYWEIIRRTNAENATTGAYS